MALYAASEQELLEQFMGEQMNIMILFFSKAVLSVSPLFSVSFTRSISLSHSDLPSHQK